MGLDNRQSGYQKVKLHPKRLLDVFPAAPVYWLSESEVGTLFYLKNFRPLRKSKMFEISSSFSTPTDVLSALPPDFIPRCDLPADMWSDNSRCNLDGWKHKTSTSVWKYLKKRLTFWKYTVLSDERIVTLMTHDKLGFLLPGIGLWGSILRKVILQLWTALESPCRLKLLMEHPSP